MTPDGPPLDIYAGGSAAIGEGLESYRDMDRPGIALYVGGMGTGVKNCDALSNLIAGVL